MQAGLHRLLPRPRLRRPRARRPALLILDEPTSQMDSRGEHLIFERVRAIVADRITEQGRYDDLVHAGGTFAELLALSQDR